MQLALRRDAPTNATQLQEAACWTIRARLVSEFCHGGIVIDGVLYHATAARGLHSMQPSEWTTDNWLLMDVGGDDAAALALFDKHKGAQYDWIGLLAFVGFRAGRDDWMYCFEWCYLAITGNNPVGRVTVEKLLLLGEN